MYNEFTREKIATFQERFAELCDSSPMSDTSIADALNVSRQTVCSWKAGTRSPKKPTILTIANYFGVDVAWLMGFDVAKEPGVYSLLTNTAISAAKYAQAVSSPKTPEARILAKGIDNMPQEQREAIVTMMQRLYPGLFEKGTEEDET